MRDMRGSAMDLLEKEGIFLLVFCGTGDFAEIAFISTQGTQINMIAVVDVFKVGGEFLNHAIQDIDALSSMHYDKILVTAVENMEEVTKRILEAGISSDKLIMM